MFSLPINAVFIDDDDAARDDAFFYATVESARALREDICSCGSGTVVGWWCHATGECAR